MGLDLTLLFPLWEPCELIDGAVLCSDRLNLDRDYAIFGQLLTKDLPSGRKGGQDGIPASPMIKPFPIPAQMWVDTFEDEGIERRREDKYGEGLTFVFAKQLKTLNVPDDTSAKNKAIMAFVGALPDDTPIILDWY